MACIAYDRTTEFLCLLRSNHSAVKVGNVPIAEIDKVLHAERVVAGGFKKKYVAALTTLPTGSMFEYKGNAFLNWKRKVYRWTLNGYTEASMPTGAEQVMVLTPASIVRMFEGGFIPEVFGLI